MTTDTMLNRLKDETGQTLAEYGILITVIAIVVLVVAALIGNEIPALFSSVLAYL